jgi:hypothetical protein
MQTVRHGATVRGLDPVGQGADRAAPREGARERERGEEGGDRFVTQWLLLPIYKREGEPR